MQDIHEESLNESVKSEQSPRVVLWEIDLTVQGGERCRVTSSRQYFPTSRQHAGFAAVLPRTVSAFYPHPVSPPA